MNKKHLLFWSIILSFFLYACSDEFEYDRQIAQEAIFDNFGTKDAQSYFENNASDLSPLRFSKEAPTKSDDLPELQLIPEWSKAIVYGHSQLRIIEVPIRSNSLNKFTELVVREGKLTDSRNAYSGRHLVIARYPDGATDMFVITIVPDASFKGDAGKHFENFRYLGGGNFTGWGFCSTLEGDFIKAYGYTDGKINGLLTVMRKSELQKHASEEFAQNYSSISFQEGILTRSGVYAYGENPDNPACPHGYEEGCPYCMDEVVVTGCPKCKTTNGCTCKEPSPDSGGNDKEVILGGNVGGGNWGNIGDGSGGGGMNSGNSNPPSDNKGNPPTGDRNKQIFHKDSRLSETQWKKLEKALQNINKDPLGKKIIDKLVDKNILIKYDPQCKANGEYNHEKKQLTIKNFQESDMRERVFEKTIFHELLHSLQSYNKTAMMNLEIEAHLATYQYAKKYKIGLKGSQYSHMNLLSLYVDNNYNITNQKEYDVVYETIIKDFKATDYYKDFPESSTHRNLNNIKNLINSK